MACDKPKPIYYALLRQKTLRAEEKKPGKENFQVEIRNPVYVCWQIAAVGSLFLFFNPD